ncbi:MAG: ABC transporter permease [Terriglobales bacterium]
MASLSLLAESAIQDIRYTLRGLRRNPLFAVAAVLTVALGVGASTAVFSAVDRVLFRPLPYDHPAELVAFGYKAPVEPSEFYLGADYMDLRRLQNSPFAQVTAWSGLSACDLTDIRPERMTCGQIESSFLPTFGVTPLVGRNFSTEEDRPNAPRTALLSYGFWRSRYGASESIVGRTIPIDGQPVRVVGVLPRNFEVPASSQPDVLLPLGLDEAQQVHPRTGRVLRTFARLQPGVTAAQARERLEPLFRQEMQFVPPAFRHEVKFQVRPLRAALLGDSRRAAWMLLGAVIIVLFIACANVAGLLLARFSSRHEELVVRSALGAGRMRLARMALTESMVVAALGAVAALALAFGLMRLFSGLAPQSLLEISTMSLNVRVLLFGLLVSCVAGLVFGVAPALQTPSIEALSSSRVSGSRHVFFRQALVGIQVAASVILAITAGLLLRSLWNTEAVPIGMHTDHVVAAEINLGSRYAQPAQRVEFFRRLEQRLRQVPGVESVALTDTLPPSGRVRSRPFSTLQLEGAAHYEGGTGGMVAWRTVTPDYFSTLSIPILRGRPFTEADRTSTEFPMVLSASLARRLFHNEDPIGKRLKIQFADVPWFTVVGVAADVKNGGLTSGADPEYYVARRDSASDAWDHSIAVVRTSLGAAAVSTWVRDAVAELDPTLPVGIETLDQRVSSLAAAPRFDALLLVAFAGIAIVLAGTGMYGVIAFLVTQRTREIGIRMALGAQRAHILRLVAGSGMLAVGVSEVVGTAAALMGERALRSMLFGVAPADPLTIVAAEAVVLAVSLFAMLVPARRATRVDPVESLRHE